MGKVTVSVDIRAAPEAVFSLIKDTKQVVSLMPIGWQVDADKLTKEPTGVGTEYAIRIKSLWLRIAYRDKVEEFVENNKIRSRSVNGFNYTNLVWSVEANNDGARLTRKAEFELPYSFLGTIIDKLVAERVFRRVGENWLRNIKAHLEGRAK